MILQAAMEVFAHHGYQAASMRLIAAVAGVSTPVIYDHFGSKRELHIELLDQQADALIAYSTRAVEGESFAQLTRRNVDAYFQYVEEHPYAWRMLFRDPPADPDIAAAHRRADQRAVEAIGELFATVPELATTCSLDRGQVNHTLAQATKAAMNGLAAWWWDQRDVPREQLTAICLDLLWRGLATLASPP